MIQVRGDPRFMKDPGLVSDFNSKIFLVDFFFLEPSESGMAATIRAHSTKILRPLDRSSLAQYCQNTLARPEVPFYPDMNSKFIKDQPEVCAKIRIKFCKDGTV